MIEISSIKAIIPNCVSKTVYMFRDSEMQVDKPLIKVEKVENKHLLD